MKTIKQFKWWFVSFFTVLFIIGAVTIPLPYYLEIPGGAYDIRNVLTVNEINDSEEGSYNFVAVTVSRASLAQIIYSWFTPFADITSIEETTGGYSQEDYWRINQFYMKTSQNSAVYQALKLAGKEAKLDYQGVYVLNVSEDSTFKNILNLADTVTGINGKTFKSSQELINYVSSFKIGDDVTVQYISNGISENATGKIIKLENGKNGIGIGLVDHTEVNTKIPITFNTEDVGGPSAGLMFTLDIYDQLIDEDLRKGRIIAGTGTIEQDGSVGDVGGIDKKVVSADEIGAKIFFVPNNPITDELKNINPDAKTNYEEALETVKKLKTDMKIIPVKTIEEAIAYLRTH
ncbi:SepM family pheromone-processing serine protease [Streptococcus marimammalium]|uniref:SepM family pheromone-processing serine protease n=1 Tax=Streptococcus marimammalium TaxID=269666 RepID=UPI00036F2146|nr:SepM family pheromone-processing serine protease [Streptococcus marimammalium]